MDLYSIGQFIGEHFNDENIPFRLSFLCLQEALSPLVIQLPPCDTSETWSGSVLNTEGKNKNTSLLETNGNISVSMVSGQKTLGLIDEVLSRRHFFSTSYHVINIYERL